MKSFIAKINKEEKLRDTTLVFLVKKTEGNVSEICLAMKKRGFGMNRWNGTGGKLKEGESVHDAAKRETKEEIGVDVMDLKKVAEHSFYFPHNPAWHQKVHVYFSEVWDGDISESEEMRPQWFNVNELPFNDMWPDDIFWVPKVISGKLLNATFVFGEGDVILEKEILEVGNLI